MTDPWGNPLSPDDQPPATPRPDDYPPDFAQLPAAESAPNPAWPGHSSATPSTPPPPAAPPGAGAPPPAWPGYPAPPQPTWQGPKFAGMAIASMICGILSITCTGFLGIILGPTALGLGLAGRRAIDASNGWKKGNGMATAGIVTGVIGIVLSIVYLIFLLKNPNFITDFVNNLTTTTTTAGKLQGA